MSNQFFLFLYQQNGLKIDLKMRQRKLKNKKIFASSKKKMDCKTLSLAMKK